MTFIFQLGIQELMTLHVLNQFSRFGCQNLLIQEIASYQVFFASPPP